MTGTGTPFIYASGYNATLHNNTTIEGWGRINLDNNVFTLVNGGTRFANAASPLEVGGGNGLTNNGTFKVAAGSTLHIENNGPGPFTNFSGSTLTGDTYNISGTLEIDQLGASGGEIVTNAANIILNGASSSFVDVGGLNALTNLNTNATDSAFTIIGGRNFTTAGNFPNNGTLTVGRGSLFDVNGNLTNISGSTISGGAFNLTGILKANNASGITTNSAKITLTGSGGLENQSGTNALTRLTTNTSGSSFTINGGANFTTTGSFTNSGTLTVGNTSTFNSAAGNYTNAGTTTIQKGGTFTAAGTLTNTGTFTNAGTLQSATGATLDLKGGAYTNKGGTILASGTGSQVLLDAATISGGTLTSKSGGALVGENSAILNGSTSPVTISAGSTLNVNNGQTLQALGTLTNNGTFTLNSTGTNTELRLTGNLTLGGPGKLTLSNNAANLISATATTDVLTNASTIQGSGNLGNGAMGVVNTKTITANQSTPLIIDTSSAGFNNTGTLTVRKGDTLQIKGGAFANLSGTTLTGGTYSVSGTLLYNSTSDIVTNAASITLTGASAQIINQSGGNGWRTSPPIMAASVSRVAAS